MLESFLVKRMKFKPSGFLRFITRNAYVFLTLFLAVTFPFFGGLLAPVRNVAYHLQTKEICIVFGVLLMVLAPIGVLRQIILEATDYKFYSCSSSLSYIENLHEFTSLPFFSLLMGQSKVDLNASVLVLLFDALRDGIIC
ncbi:hypothetical protein Fmac_026088 [Flemingia macrophylla]|uniref:Uncharacterized protein n=1 Tax=Flemingia macrophylla TaxID=520843 RepID=A0ABD1LDV4_9FABA